MDAARLSPAALLLAALAACAPQANPPTGVVLISLDTCRADRLSCYGAERATTPRIDALAAESLRFTDCRAQSTVTAPSHLSLLSGQQVWRHGLTRNGEARRPSRSLASVLSEAGWRTAAFTGHGSFQAKFGHGEGFEEFQSWVGEERWPFQRNLRAVVPHALRWLDGIGERPFFLVVHGYDPHMPWAPTAPWSERWTSWYTGELDPQLLMHPETFRPLLEEQRIGAAERRWVRDLYDAELAAADEQIGLLLDGLRERGLLERAILVFTSDHGELLGEHDWFGHGHQWEPEIRVPLLMRFPDDGLRGVRDDPVQHVDVVPTLLSALGLDAPPGLQGLDLMPILRGERAALDPDRLRVCRTGERVSALVGGRWKLVFVEVDGALERPRLFDLRDDPGETRDLIRSPGGRERFDELAAVYRAWREGERDGDRRFAGSALEPAEEGADLPMLRALGYVGTEDDG